MDTKKKYLKEKIPEIVYVSCFEINCKEILGYLLEKQEELSKQLKTLIAKRARDATTTIFNEFNVIKDKINHPCENIE